MRFRFDSFDFEQVSQMFDYWLMLWFYLLLLPVKKYTAKSSIFLFTQIVKFIIIDPSVYLNFACQNLSEFLALLLLLLFNLNLHFWLLFADFSDSFEVAG